MAKSTIFILASALCFLSFFGSTYGSGENHIDKFVVHGMVYCDTCNVQFVTKLSEPMAGAKVRLECRDFEDSNNITLNTQATTDENGLYNIKVDGDHAEEVCQVVLVASSREDCAKWDELAHVQQAAKLSITSDNGIIQTQDRVANALGFLKNEPLPECADVLKELGLNADGSEIDDSS